MLFTAYIGVSQPKMPKLFFHTNATFSIKKLALFGTLSMKQRLNTRLLSCNVMVNREEYAKMTYMRPLIPSSGVSRDDKHGEEVCDLLPGISA